MERGLLVIAAALLLSSCSAAGPYLQVVRGGQAFNRGDLQEANIDYLKAEGKHAFASWVAYNLGTVYYALGETAAAEKQWHSAVQSDSPELKFRALYNSGVLAYETGRYQEAYDDFKSALMLTPSSVEAKINLELSLARINYRSTLQAKSVQKTDKTPSNSGEVDRILNYLKRTENQTWTSTEKIQEDKNVRDW